MTGQTESNMGRVPAQDPTIRNLAVLVGLALVSPIVIPLSEWTKISDCPPGLGKLADLIQNLAVVGGGACALGFTFIGMLFLLSRRSRRFQYGPLFYLCCVILLASLPLWFVGGKALWSVKRAGMKKAATRLEPVIQALDAYKTDTGEYPSRLEDLIPRYINEMPTTGMSGYRSLTYEKVDDDDKAGGKKWGFETGGYKLAISTPTGIINWDQFFYVPSEKYPDTTSSGSIEWIGKWAYLHE